MFRVHKSVFGIGPEPDAALKRFTPRYFFDRESNMFRREFVLPVSPGAQPKGSSESTALVLEDITLEEFEKFLWVFYNPRCALPACSWRTSMTEHHCMLQIQSTTPRPKTGSTSSSSRTCGTSGRCTSSPCASSSGSRCLSWSG